VISKASASNECGNGDDRSSGPLGRKSATRVPAFGPIRALLISMRRSTPRNTPLSVEAEAPAGSLDPVAILVRVQIVIASATMTSRRDMPGRASRAAI